MNKSYLDNFIDPVFDRSEQDLNNLRYLLKIGYNNFTQEQKLLWNSDLKGALNSSDMNRINKNIYALSQCMGISYTLKSYSEGDILSESDFTSIQSGLNNIRSEILSISSIDIGPPPDLPYNTYTKFNTIEEMVFKSYNILKNL